MDPGSSPWYPCKINFRLDLRDQALASLHFNIVYLVCSSAPNCIHSLSTNLMKICCFTCQNVCSVKQLKEINGLNQLEEKLQEKKRQSQQDLSSNKSLAYRWWLVYCFIVMWCRGSTLLFHHSIIFQLMIYVVLSQILWFIRIAIAYFTWTINCKNFSALKSNNFNPDTSLL